MPEATHARQAQRCPRCQDDLGRESFASKSWGKSGAYCRACNRSYLAAWRTGDRKPRVERGLPRHAVWFPCDLWVRVEGSVRRRKLRKPAIPKVQLAASPARVGYISMHARLAKTLGPARNRECVECGKQAAEWAYDHADPDELEGSNRKGRVATYSLDPNHYLPMCRSCHSHHDRAHWFATRLAPVLDAHGIDAAVRDTVLKEVRSFR